MTTSSASDFDNILVALGRFRPTNPSGAYDFDRTMTRFRRFRPNANLSAFYLVGTPRLSTGALTPYVAPAPNVLSASPLVTATRLSTGALALTWKPMPVNFNVQLGVPSVIDLSQYAALISAVLPACLKLDTVGKRLIYDGTGTPGPQNIVATT